eukprot:scaffold6996_cov112-Isochrysis_galbana.AAC.9
MAQKRELEWPVQLQELAPAEHKFPRVGWRRRRACVRLDAQPPPEPSAKDRPRVRRRACARRILLASGLRCPHVRKQKRVRSGARHRKREVAE